MPRSGINGGSLKLPSQSPILVGEAPSTLANLSDFSHLPSSSLVLCPGAPPAEPRGGHEVRGEAPGCTIQRGRKAHRHTEVPPHTLFSMQVLGVGDRHQGAYAQRRTQHTSLRSGLQASVPIY